MAKKLIFIDLVGATPSHFHEPCLFPRLKSIFGQPAPLEPVFPALTCPVQVSMLTGTTPQEHGIIANGLFDRASRQVTMWTWPASRIERPLVWDILRARGLKTAVMFFQGLKGTNADIFINPHPKHTPDGRAIPWCDSRPADLYERLAASLGHFPLHKYWGPMADIESSEWILRASLETLRLASPDVMFVYVPHLDYAGQRFGPDSAEFRAEAAAIDKAAAEFISGVGNAAGDAEFFLLSEYAFTNVCRSASPNVALRRAGLLNVTASESGELPDMKTSKAFALVDHQVAHVYCFEDSQAEAMHTLGELDGVAAVFAGKARGELGLDHSNAGDLVLVAEPDAWFNYYWWEDAARAPSFARTVDIHRKPGYDPVELFVDPASRTIPLSPELIRGSHGLVKGYGGGSGIFGSIDVKIPAVMKATEVMNVAINRQNI